MDEISNSIKNQIKKLEEMQEKFKNGNTSDEVGKFIAISLQISELSKTALEILKHTAQEVAIQEQSPININQLRIENGLKPIPNGDTDFIPIK